MHNTPRSPASTIVWRTVLIYVFFGALWIAVSDYILTFFFSDPEIIRTISIYKGWAYVVITGLLLFSLLRTQLTYWEEENKKRKYAEEELHEKEQQFELITENISDVLWILDFDTTHFLYVSNSVFRLRGYTVEEALQQTLLESVSDRSMAYLDKVIPERIAEFKTGMVKSYVDEIEQPCKDGRIVLTETTTQFFINESTGHLEVYGTSRDITQRKAAEYALIESKSKYQELVDRMNEGLMQVDNDDRILFVNSSFCTMVDYTREELIGRIGYELIIPDKYKTLIQNKNKNRITGISDHYELPLRKKSGDLIWTFVSASPMLNEDNIVIGSLGVFTDITDRRRAEEELHVKDFAVNSSISGIGLANLGGIITYVNPAFLCMWEIDDINDVIGQHISEFSFDAQKLQQAIELLHRGESYSGETSGKGKKGRDFVAQLSVNLVNNADGKPIYIMASFVDITEQKKMEQANVLLAHTMKSISEMATITDLEKHIIFVNDAFVQTFGFTREELIGQHININWSPRNPDSLRDDIRANYGSGNWRGELLKRTKDGRDIPVFLKISQVKNEAGDVIAIAAISEDISQKKQMEAEHAALEEKLIHSQKMESIGTLAAGIAHDFNNILGIIIGYSRLLTSYKENEDKFNHGITTIISAAERGSGLVKQMLMFARKTTTVYAPFNINTLVKEFQKLFNETFPKNISIVLSLQDDLPDLKADVTQIHQVLLNLCVNARDAMPKGGILSITTTLLDNESMVKQFPKAHFQQYIVVTVRDTGVGMDEETQRRIFEPFFSTKDIGKGTGLGLSVVFGIMESHRGFISVDSTIENGTTFSVYLPVQTDTLHTKNELPSRGHNAESGTETILVVEDEEMLRELITTKLTSAGYSVLSAKNGRDGLEQFQRHRSSIDAVFTDMGLPLIDGVEMSKKILASAPTIILLITSGYFSPELTAELDALGVQHRIQKPYDPAFVIKTLRTAFDAKVKHVEK